MTGVVALEERPDLGVVGLQPSPGLDGHRASALPRLLGAVYPFPEPLSTHALRSLDRGSQTRARPSILDPPRKHHRVPSCLRKGSKAVQDLGDGGGLICGWG